MKEKIERYIKHMIEKHKIMAAMVAGSYVTGEMCSNSDIDIFFVWEKEFESMRGREYFEGVEFEYFISPEWKYYDRLRTDKTSMRIYSSSQILLDHNNIIKKIQETAAKKIRNYSCDLSIKRWSIKKYRSIKGAIMEEKIDLEKFNFKNSKNECHVELGMHFKSKILLFSFLMSIILLIQPLMDIFNGNIDMIMIFFDLFIALFLLFANILFAISIYSKEISQ